MAVRGIGAAVAPRNGSRAHGAPFCPRPQRETISLTQALDYADAALRDTMEHGLMLAFQWAVPDIWWRGWSLLMGREQFFKCRQASRLEGQTAEKRAGLENGEVAPMNVGKRSVW